MGFLSRSAKTASEEPVKAAPPPAGLSVIAVGMAVLGSLDSNGTVKIEGTVQGDVSTRAQALVARGGIVEGDLSADEVVVGGTVTGAVRARTRVEIQSGAVVEGDVTTRRILVAEGATLNGRVRMGEEVFDEAVAGGGPRMPESMSSPVLPSRPAVPVAQAAVPPRQPLP
jgi:cytoskeletal protein CcmA (bactofilin family)